MTKGDGGFVCGRSKCVGVDGWLAGLTVELLGLVAGHAVGLPSVSNATNAGSGQIKTHYLALIGHI